MRVSVLRVGSLPQGTEGQRHERGYNPDTPAATQPRAVENGVRSPLGPAGLRPQSLPARGRQKQQRPAEVAGGGGGGPRGVTHGGWAGSGRGGRAGCI